MATEKTLPRLEELATTLEALTLLQELDPAQLPEGLALRLTLLTLAVGQLAGLCGDQQQQLNDMKERYG